MNSRASHAQITIDLSCIVLVDKTFLKKTINISCDRVEVHAGNFHQNCMTKSTQRPLCRNKMTANCNLCQYYLKKCS